MWSHKKYVMLMVLLPWLYAITISSYVVLVASDNIRSYTCSPLNAMHPKLGAPVVALINAVLTVGVVVVYSIGIYKSARSGIRELVNCCLDRSVNTAINNERHRIL